MATPRKSKAEKKPDRVAELEKEADAVITQVCSMHPRVNQLLGALNEHGNYGIAVKVVQTQAEGKAL